MKKLIWGIIILAVVVAAYFIVSLNSSSNIESPDQPVSNVKAISYSILNSFPHDTSSFTEGLLIYNNEMYESTGLNGQSKLLKTDIKTGKILRAIDIPNNYFGEGISIVNDTIYQLTYQEKIGLMYALKDFKKIGEFKYVSPEGWGMTFDGKNIIASDGSSNLSFYAPGSFKLTRQITVTYDGTPASNINELEFIDGYIYANVWNVDYLYKIDPSNGQVVGKIDFSAAAQKLRNKFLFAKELNGIAYDAVAKKIYITGKNWPELYEIQLGQ